MSVSVFVSVAPPVAGELADGVLLLEGEPVPEELGALGDGDALPPLVALSVAGDADGLDVPAEPLMP